MEHLSEADLQTFFGISPTRSNHARVASHLLAGCMDCRDKAIAAFEARGRRSTVMPTITLSELIRESGLIRLEYQRAALSWARLASTPHKERLRQSERKWRFKKYGLAVYIFEEADILAQRGRLDRARECADFVGAVIDFLPERVYGAAPIADLRLRFQTTLANLFRLANDFVGALGALDIAEAIRNKAIDPFEAARFKRVQASLFWDLGEFEDSAAAAYEATAIYTALGDQQSRAKSLLLEAMVLAWCKPESGLARADEGLAILNPAESYPYVTGLYNRAFCLIQLGRTEEASAFLSAYDKIIREVTDARAELLFRVLDALILKARGNAKEADELFEYLALRFGEEKMFQEMLLSHVERIEIRIEAGHWKAALNLARRLTPELARLGLRNDLLSMWATLQDGLASRRQAVATAREFFKRHWKVPAR